MAGPTTITQYLATQPPATRKVLREVIAIIRKTVPSATAGISYGIPAFKLDGKVLLYTAGWKEHYSLYPVTPPLIKALGKVTAPHELSHKGTIRFPLSERIPAGLIAKIAKLRVAALRDKTRA